MEGQLIEYIASLRNPGGGPLVRIEGSQLRVAAFPPFTTLTTTLTPLASDYAMICYRTILGNEIVPGAFSGTLLFASGVIYSGVITQEPIRNGFQVFFVITKVTPLTYTITNLTGLFHYFEAIGKYLLVSTKDDMEFIYKVLQELTTTGPQSLLAETNRLLADIRRALRPPPPLPLSPPLLSGDRR